MRNRFALLVLMLLVVCTAQAHAYSAMFVFGDSLSDNGNNAIALPLAGIRALRPRYAAPVSARSAPTPAATTIPTARC